MNKIFAIFTVIALMVYFTLLSGCGKEKGSSSEPSNTSSSVSEEDYTYAPDYGLPTESIGTDENGEINEDIVTEDMLENPEKYNTVIIGNNSSSSTGGNNSQSGTSQPSSSGSQSSSNSSSTEKEDDKKEESSAPTSGKENNTGYKQDFWIIG